MRIFLICVLGLLFGACSGDDRTDKTSGNNGTDKTSNNPFQHICNSMDNNFQPCVDIQGENEEELVKKIDTCDHDAFRVFIKINVDENTFTTEAEKQIAELKYQNVLLRHEVCVASIPSYEAQIPKSEFRKRCISRFISNIQSNFCSE